MSGFAVIRTARKPHHCDTRSYACVGTIQPGQRYVYAALPPYGEFGGPTWRHEATCSACAIAYDRPEAAEVI